ncbi:hypothetical protein QTP86_012143 [Hemibagrus guttatus]|nr:hypothetical protein QTP86_012143 [Hemibagrus guttatus]
MFAEPENPKHHTVLLPATDGTQRLDKKWSLGNYSNNNNEKTIQSSDQHQHHHHVVAAKMAPQHSVLQDRFQHTDWSMFAIEATCGTHTDINPYTSSVLDYINTTIDSVTTEKQITTYPNQKPWMNKEVRLLLKARNAAFRSRDTSETHEDVNLALTPLEQKLCRHFARMTIIGKRGRKVPLLLTPIMRESLDLLTEKFSPMMTVVSSAISILLWT